jgi:hypothetical protein
MEISMLLTITKKEDLNALHEFLKMTSIQTKVVSHTDAEQIEPELKVFNYIPTASFKELCGAEHLNKRGHTSLESAYNLILTYTKRRGLYRYPYIDIDSYLSGAISISEHSILISELIAHLKKIFVKSTV